MVATSARLLLRAWLVSRSSKLAALPRRRASPRIERMPEPPKIMRVENPPYRCPNPACHDKPVVVDGRVFACCEHLSYSEDTVRGLVLYYSASV